MVTSRYAGLVIAFALAAGCAGVQTKPIPGGESVVVEAPTFKVGDEWRFVGPGYRSRVRIVQAEGNGIMHERDVLAGPPNACAGCRYFRDSNLTLVKVLDTNGKPRPEVALGVKYLEFPLRVGKEWTQTIDLPAGGATRTFVNRFKVEAYEEITTKAGALKAFRISQHQENVMSGWRGLGMSWWSPEARWYVRIESFRERGLSTGDSGGTDLELESYSLK